MHMYGQLSKDLATFFRCCHCLCAGQWVRWLKCVFPFFFRMTIIIFSFSYFWTIKIWLIMFLATGKSGELFRGTWLKVYLFSATVAVCFWSIRFLSMTNVFSFLIEGGPPACHVLENSSHVINRCWQCFDYLECDSYCQHHDNQGWIYWRANGEIFTPI